VPRRGSLRAARYRWSASRPKGACRTVLGPFRTRNGSGVGVGREVSLPGVYPAPVQPQYRYLGSAASPGWATGLRLKTSGQEEFRPPMGRTPPGEKSSAPVSLIVRRTSDSTSILTSPPVAPAAARRRQTVPPAVHRTLGRDFLEFVARSNRAKTGDLVEISYEYLLVVAGVRS
jgi:hypothetical protein